MKLLRSPWFYVALLALVLVLRRAHPEGPQLSRTKRRHLERVQAIIQARAAADTLYAAALQAAASPYRQQGLALLKHEPIIDSVAALHFADSTLASWK